MAPTIRVPTQRVGHVYLCTEWEIFSRYLERLQKQIRSAERGLCADSAEPSAVMSASAQPSSGSPAVQRNKRRHTTVTGSEASLSPEKRVKRTKTLKTYTSKRQSPTKANEESIFARFRDEAVAPKTSQSVRFSDPSGGHVSSALPAGSIQADFVNHEPAVLFRDTGDTVADGESSQQRMIEQALGSKSANSTSYLKLPESDEQKSSPFPWTASQQTESAKSTKTKDDDPAAQPEADAHKSPVTSEDAKKASDQVLVHQIIEKLGAPQHLDLKQDEGADLAKNAAVLEIIEKPYKSSPVVRVNTIDEPVASPPAKAPKSTQKPGRGRKRKLEDELTDPPNSDDVAVGLPKERYKPRPSRRRAIQVVEEEIDYSVRPEKAAKLKRLKTSNDANHTLVQDKADEPAKVTFVQNPPASTSRCSARKVNTKAKEALIEDTPLHNEVSGLTKTVQTEHDSDKGIKSLEHIDAKAGHKNEAASRSFSKDSISPTKSKEDDDNVFVKPALKAKPAKKSKRSHTTIFEDHVDFAGSQRSPSLSQQQAKRKSALQGVQNEAVTAPTQRKRRAVVRDDEDEEELNSEVAEKRQESVPPEGCPPVKKRGRGRPPKGAPAKSAGLSTQKVLSDSEDELEEIEEDDSDADEAPTKKKRGRPAKKASALLEEPLIVPPRQQSNPEPELTGKKGATATKARNSKTDGLSPEQATTAFRTPSASPEKPAAVKLAATPQKPAMKPSPTSHSPIKSSGPVSYRVGLSKRQRIPSLLRVMKPPKR